MEATGGLQGHLRLVCAPDDRGRPHLRQQSFRAPMHISKPHEDHGTLVVNVVNPTAGLLQGDVIECDVAVESGARLLLTSPSASRAHCMASGRAMLRQHFRVAAAASLDVWPEIFIPQGGARYHQRTLAEVAPGGELLLGEMLAPGRVASGEAFAYEQLRWEMDLQHAGSLIARERYTLAPGTPGVDAIRGAFPHAYYASLYAVSPALSPVSDCWAAIHQLHHARAWIGVSQLRTGWVVKVLAAGSLDLREIVSRIRRELYASLGRPLPDLRRTGVC